MEKYAPQKNRINQIYVKNLQNLAIIYKEKKCFDRCIKCLNRSLEILETSKGFYLRAVALEGIVKKRREDKTCQCSK